MDYEWDRAYKGVGVTYEEKVVRIANDPALRDFFRTKKRRGSIPLAKNIIRRHESIYGKTLMISDSSLAAEIHGHFMIQEIFLRLRKIFGDRRFIRWMLRHMDVIDCGGRAVDNNRFVWDIFSIFYRA